MKITCIVQLSTDIGFYFFSSKLLLLWCCRTLVVLRYVACNHPIGWRSWKKSKCACNAICTCQCIWQMHSLGYKRIIFYSTDMQQKGWKRGEYSVLLQPIAVGWRLEHSIFSWVSKTNLKFRGSQFWEQWVVCASKSLTSPCILCFFSIIWTTCAT